MILQNKLTNAMYGSVGESADIYLFLCVYVFSYFYICT